MSEKKSHFCTLSDKELIEKATELVQQLIDTGGKSWVLNIPARPNADPDLIFTELNYRFNNLIEQLQLSPVWIKASTRLPLHKAFWNMPGDCNNNECFFPVRIDGNKYRVGEIFDERKEGASEPVYMFVIKGEDFYEKDFHRIEWLDENEFPAEKGFAKDEQPVREVEAIEFAKWLKHLDNGTTHYNPFTKEETGSIGFSPYDCFSDDSMTVDDLYKAFKKQK